MNRPLRAAGALIALIALLAMNGEHWLALQSVAWARMFAGFAQHDSLRVALAKTLSGQYPCSICLKVRHGWQEEQRQERKSPGVQTEKMAEFICEWRPVTAPPAPEGFRDCPEPGTRSYSDFISSPPTPPPRGFEGGV
jgi:hypothetical protein